jgi:glycosyltransferase involved in cell wall biosynthesis
MNLKVDVLISCMHNNNTIIQKSNLSHDVIVINQSDVNRENTTEYANRCLFVDSPSRGLSCSRNLAIQKSKADICIISDDDEVFTDNAQGKIANIYKRHPKADIIIFEVLNNKRKSRIKNEPHRMSYLEMLRVNSWQITFRRERIIDKDISFDQLMGSGTGNGAGEEVKFLLDAYKKGLRIYYFPYQMAEVAEGENQSKWFNSFDKNFFFQRGYSTRYMLGLPLSSLYALYYVLSHEEMFKDQISKKTL